MRTPAGKECPYFYGNYFRGRNIEECRLIGDVPPPHHYTPDLCNTCPVPQYILANSCPHLEYKASVKNALLKRWRRVEISAFCRKSGVIVKEPQIGCGQCHPNTDFVFGQDDATDNLD